MMYRFNILLQKYQFNKEKTNYSQSETFFITKRKYVDSLLNVICTLFILFHVKINY
jgi:hypothetical protein